MTATRQLTPETQVDHNQRCAVCAHYLADHDPISHRYCQATQAHALSRSWVPAPRRMQIEGRTVRLGGFTVGEPSSVTLSDAWGHERIDILVIAPDTDPAVAQRIFEIASTANDAYRAEEILGRANRASTHECASTHESANRS